jgi:hypothetical protein
MAMPSVRSLAKSVLIAAAAPLKMFAALFINPAAFSSRGTKSGALEIAIAVETPTLLTKAFDAVSTLVSAAGSSLAVQRLMWCEVVQEQTQGFY